MAACAAPSRNMIIDFRVANVPSPRTAAACIALLLLRGLFRRLRVSELTRFAGSQVRRVVDADG